MWPIIGMSDFPYSPSFALEPPDNAVRPFLAICSRFDRHAYRLTHRQSTVAMRVGWPVARGFLQVSVKKKMKNEK